MALHEGVRIRIVRGNPTPEEVAAALLALDGVALDRVAPAPARTPTSQTPWQRAARLEGLGGAPLTGADDPRLRRLYPFE